MFQLPLNVSRDFKFLFCLAEAMESADGLGDKDDAYMSIEPTDEGAG